MSRLPKITALRVVGPAPTPDQAEIDDLNRARHYVYPLQMEDAPQRDPLIRNMIRASLVLILAALGVAFLAGNL